jgi:hypothetical protein
MTKQITLPCLKCGGEGRIAFYGNVKGGVCFKCGGTGLRATTTAKEKARLQAKARREAEATLRSGDYEARISSASAATEARYEAALEDPRIPEKAKTLYRAGKHHMLADCVDRLARQP